jgi:hypothetical protein
VTERWDYQIVEEPNAVALQERLATVQQQGWEAISLGYAGECRLLVLVRRRATNSERSRSTADDVAIPMQDINTPR